MHKNNLIFPLLGLLAVTYAAPDERRKFVRVITEPKPGEEYVSIHTGKPSSGVPAKSLGIIILLFSLIFDREMYSIASSVLGKKNEF